MDDNDRDHCCVPGCNGSFELYNFPNPITNKNIFKEWVMKTRGEFVDNEYNNIYIYLNRRVCEKHFEEKYLTYDPRRGRSVLLSRDVVPTKYLAEDNKKMQPVSNQCRCCLQSGGNINIIHDDYIVGLFRETLNLLPISDLRLPQWICSSCITALEEAKRFRDMVTAAERQLLQALTNTHCDTSTTQPMDNVWIKEEAKDLDTEDQERDEDSSFQIPDGGHFNDAEIKMAVPESSQTSHLENEQKIGEKIKTQPPFVQLVDSDSQSVTLFIKEEKIDDDMKTVDENSTNFEKENGGCCPMDGNYIHNSANTSTTEQFPTNQNESQSATPNIVIVPDMRSMLGNFKTERPKNPVTNETCSSNSKRRLTAPTKLRENIILIIQHSTIIPFRHNSNFINDFICYYCDNKYKTMRELREHTESQHVGKVTDDTIMSWMRTRAHKLINADMSSIRCRLCNEQLDTIESLIEHLVIEHRKVYHDAGKRSNGILGFDLGSDELKCHLCKNDFDSFRTLYSHMNEHYEAYICYCCQKKFVNQLQYRTHLKTHVIREVRELKCDDCGASCKTKTGLVYHMKRYHLNVVLKCDLCPETFRFKEYRRREEHMVEVHGMKKPDHNFMCDVCQNGKVYSSKNTLKIHKSNVHRIGDVTRIQCEMCDFVTHHTKRMKEHMDAHNGVKNHGCDLCGKRFTKPYTLRVHMRMHLNDKRYACSLCDAAFVHKNVLQYHVKKNHPDSNIEASTKVK